MKRQIPTIKYSGLQGSFWMSFCIVFNYAAMYLLSKGFSNSQIGLIVALAGLISAGLQPVIAGLAENGGKISIRALIMTISIFMMICAGILLIPGLYFLCHALFYGILITFLQVLTPLVNAIGMEWINRGIPINFGLARGIGSVSYAAVSFLVGKIVADHSTNIIPVFIILIYFLVLIASCIFVFGRDRDGSAITEPVQKEYSDEQEGKMQASFLASYKKFFVLLIGASLVFVSHNMLNNFLFQIMQYHGGGSTEMGAASGIAAFLELPTMIGFTWLVSRISSGNLLKISSVFFTLKALLMLLAGNIGGIFVAQTAQMFGFALFTPASVYYTNSLIRPSDRVKGQAYMTATNTVGSVFGSFLGGVLLDVAGVPIMILAAFAAGVIGTVILFFTAEKTS